MTTVLDLRRARLNAGLSQRALADAIGVSRETVRLAESGGTVPHPATAKKIADHFGMQVTDLWPMEHAA